MNEQLFTLLRPLAAGIGAAMRDGSATKAKIEAAALELFAERGVNGTTIRRIKRAAGVSLGALYVHYRTKEELARALFVALFTEIADELDAIADAEPTLERKLRAMIAHIYAEADRDQSRMSFLFLMRQNYARIVRRGSHNPFFVFRRVIVEAMTRGVIPTRDANLATASVCGVVNQVADTKLLGRLPVRLADWTGEVTAGCLRLLKG